MNHSFVIPAYGHSPFLEDCLKSLVAQTLRCPVVVCTSTPFDGLDNICRRFDVRLHIHLPNRGIGADWNAALAMAGTELVTLAHQDDIYLSEFSAQILAAAERNPESAMLFSDTEEIAADGNIIPQHRNTSVKRLISRIAFAGRAKIHGPVSLRLLLGLGNPITCPAVTIHLSRNKKFLFREDLRTNMDWLAWIELARCGGIIRVPEVLMQHRAHDQSETAKCLFDGARSKEDRMVFDRMWPRPLASILGRLYQRSYAGYSK